MKPEDFDPSHNRDCVPSGTKSSGVAHSNESATEESATEESALSRLAAELTAGQSQADFWSDPDAEEDEKAIQRLVDGSISFLSSLIFHLILMIVLLFLTFPAPRGPGKGPQLSMEFGEVQDEEEWLDWLEELDATVTAEAKEEVSSSDSTKSEMESLLPEETEMDVEETPDVEDVEEPELPMIPLEDPTQDPLAAEDLMNATPADPERTGESDPSAVWQPETLQSGTSGSTNWNQQVTPSRSFPTGGSLGPRTDAVARAQMLSESGGNAQSENAVERGLAWIARHQQFDPNRQYYGSWNFALPGFRTQNPGEATSHTAATAMALLALMGHGNTREEGEYRKQVQDGIYFLSTRARSRATQPGYDFRDSQDSHGMYGHILATLALCEAYALEKNRDPNLQALAQGAVLWLLYAQDPEGGGWRYQPHEAGDVSITTWVVMALKSAQMAGFEIPTETVAKLDLFLDAISTDKKTRYRYQPGKLPEASTTAMGLCARVFSGAPRNADFLERGTQLVSDWGSDETDLYYDYYATLLLRHYGGARWKKWNAQMRDYLIITQETSGPDEGSWFFTEPKKSNNQIGGRLYTTAMAVMILEVYYRYLPIYQEQSATGL